MDREMLMIDGKKYYIQTPVDAAIFKDKIKEHTAGTIFYFPWWTPKNLWRNHWGQRAAIRHEARVSCQAEDSMDEYLFECAAARLEEDLNGIRS